MAHAACVAEVDDDGAVSLCVEHRVLRCQLVVDNGVGLLVEVLQTFKHVEHPLAYLVGVAASLTIVALLQCLAADEFAHHVGNLPSAEACLAMFNEVHHAGVVNPLHDVHLNDVAVRIELLPV